MKIIKSYASWFLLLFVVGITSCEKTELKDGGGKTLVKIIGGGDDPLVIPMDVNPPVEELLIADLRKDAVTEADAMAATTVTITNTQAFLDDYNNDHGTAFELLPTSAYTITPESGVTVSGNTWTVNLAPGELARPISIVLDKSQMDLSKSYAFGLQITQTTVGSPSLGSGVIIVNPLVINKYDGIYEVTGSMVDAANATLTGLFPFEYHLITTGERSVAGFDPVYWEDYFIPIMSGSDVSGYGAFSPIFTFDANDNVTAVTNIYGQPASNGRYAQLDPSGINKWDPATGNIDVKFFMFQPSVVSLPNPRVSFDWHMAYTGPR
ncbi:MAG TPA: DUF1735 domain-containing protein [Chitinophagaceae bacterium]|nr:DUF1735 domain-containing protein [Chitinophagaceae bacterium]